MSSENNWNNGRDGELRLKVWFAGLRLSCSASRELAMFRLREGYRRHVKHWDITARAALIHGESTPPCRLLRRDLGYRRPPIVGEASRQQAARVLRSQRPPPRQFPLELARSTYGLIATTGVILLEDPCGDVAVTHSPGLSILIFGRLVSGTTTLKVMYFRSGS